MMPTVCNTSMKRCRQRNWHIQTISTDMDANYYSNYLKAYLTDAGDARKDDEDFISARADAASEEYEVAPCRCSTAMRPGAGHGSPDGRVRVIFEKPKYSLACGT